MNPHKCDMCGLYLESDGASCEECIKAASERRKVIKNYDNLKNKEELESEQYTL